ncbi:hypothetical protein ERO13_A13G018901v2 [Gossypium hirsutum]|uniref:Uncharacterized protein n=1 Tax=Gossypium hirsutum TaxID=3635 RepID=A0ABM2ZCF6_GOSHI|nr:uncharacterized protein LOC107931632 [Gossypium hirsutum]KAG4164485.1 hypothetical protein ERO13_A13G018901v2 [Gossypium hirsutum]
MAICHFLQKSKQILTPILYPSFESQASLSYNWKKKVFPLFSFGLGFDDGEGDSGDVTVRRFRCQKASDAWVAGDRRAVAVGVRRRWQQQTCGWGFFLCLKVGVVLGHSGL